jgi:CBS domain containing-hemolysin-like protein
MDEFASLLHFGHSLGLTALEVILLIIVAAICSGLNIAVMSLDLADLKRKAKLGNKQARRVLPLRNQTHLVLGSILLTNVAAVSATSLALNRVVSSWLAGILATLLIVVFGEILPQALFAKNALYFSSLFTPLIKLMIGLTYIVSKPLEILLNQLFPKSQLKLESRHELGLIMAEHQFNDSSELDDNEIEIVQGALSLSEKRVRDIMTSISKTYWLSSDTLLDGPKIDELKAKGFSRIPVFNQDLSQFFGVLHMKNLVDLNFDDNQYLVKDMTLYHSRLVGSMTALDTLFRLFITSGSHLMPVEKDDKIVGIVTIEDLTEEIFGLEIEDETDRSKKLSALGSL